MPLLTLKSVFGCYDAKWVLVLPRKLFFTKTIDFPKIRYKSVQHFDLELALKPRVRSLLDCIFKLLSTK